MGEMRNIYKILVENPKETTPEDLGVERKIILESTLQNYGGKLWNGFTWLSIKTSGGL
jgi:hypothetical protein